MMQDGIIEIDTNDQFLLLIHLNNQVLYWGFSSISKNIKCITEKEV